MGLAPQGPHEAQRRRWTFYETIISRTLRLARPPALARTSTPLGGGEGEEAVGKVVVKGNFGKRDLGGIAHRVLNFRLEDMKTLGIGQKE